MNLRGGKLTKYQPIKSKGFHVKGRADQPDPTNIVITNDDAVQMLGRSYGVAVLSAEPGVPPTLQNAYHYEGVLNKLLGFGGVKKKASVDGFGPKYLLLGYGPQYLYFAQAPLETRTPRPNPAKPKKDEAFALPPETDTIEVCAMWEGPATGGLEKPTRDGAMGGSALNYAKTIMDPAWAEERKWEWLHIVGHSLGGNNEVGNLVAGTFDANTQMIPYEKEVVKLTQKAGQFNPVEARYVVHLYPDSWIAIDIQMMYHGCGELSGWLTARATSMLCFDKLQYDLWSL